MPETAAPDETAAQDLRPLGATADAANGPKGPPELIEADLLVEDVSIDGMCGVY